MTLPRAASAWIASSRCLLPACFDEDDPGALAAGIAAGCLAGSGHDGDGRDVTGNRGSQALASLTHWERNKEPLTHGPASHFARRPVSQLNRRPGAPHHALVHA